MEKNEDKESSRLKDKARGGILDVIEGALEEPEVKKLINRIIIKQSLESAIFLSCLLAGALMVVSAAKVVANSTWQVDAVSGIILIVVGAVYLYLKMR